eukprot:g275.t1
MNPNSESDIENGVERENKDGLRVQPSPSEEEYDKLNNREQPFIAVGEEKNYNTQGERLDEEEGREGDEPLVFGDGVEVVVLNPPHTILARDQARIGKAVAIAAKEANVALIGTTKCVCRLLTLVRCACTGVQDTDTPPPAEVDAHELKERTHKALIRLQRAEAKRAAAQGWAENEVARKEAIEKFQNLQAHARKWRETQAAKAEKLRQKKYPEEMDLFARRIGIKDPNSSGELYEKMQARKRVAKEENSRSAEKTKQSSEVKKAADISKAKEEAKLALQVDALVNRNKEIKRIQEALGQMGDANRIRADERIRLEEARRQKAEAAYGLLKSMRSLLSERLSHFQRRMKSGPIVPKVCSETLHKSCSVDTDCEVIDSTKKSPTKRNTERCMAPADILAEEEKNFPPERQPGTCSGASDGSEEGTSEKCQSDEDCPKGQKCKHSACPVCDKLRQQIASEEAIYNEEKETDSRPCNFSSDCNWHQRCQNRICTPVVDGAECEGHYDVGNGQECKVSDTVLKNGGPVKLPDFDNRKGCLGCSCSSSEECSRSLKCEGGVCRCKKEPCTGIVHSTSPKEGTPCASAATCGSGQRCMHGHCISVPEGSTCGSSAECGNGQHCNFRNICSWIRPPEGSACSSDSECGPGQKCGPKYWGELWKGKCKIICHGCKTLEWQCANGMLGLSTARGMLKTEAHVLSDMGLHAIMNPDLAAKKVAAVQDEETGDGTALCYWQSPNQGTPCKSTKDCGMAQRCDNGLCTVLQEGAKCNTNKDCGFQQRCADALCHRVLDGESCTGENIKFTAVAIEGKNSGLKVVKEGDYSKDCGNGQRCIQGECHGLDRNPRCVSNPAKSVVKAGMTADELKRAESNLNDTHLSSDCSMGEVCRDGFCIATKEGMRCVDNGDCGNNMVCTERKCHILSQPAANRSCTNTSDCGPGDRCVASVCSPVPKEYGDCKLPEKEGESTVGNCGKGQECQDGHACKPLYSGTPQELGLCKEMEDCSNTQKCIANRCKFVQEGFPCTEESDCGLNQSCALGKCRTGGSSCFSNADCSIYQACLGQRNRGAGKCTSIKIGSGCRTVADCGNSQLCGDKACENATPEDGSACSRSEDCALGFACVEKKCSLVATGSMCGKIGDCGFGQLCVAKMCEWVLPPDGSVCKNHLHCGHGQRCVVETGNSFLNTKDQINDINTGSDGVCESQAEGDPCSLVDLNGACANGQKCKGEKGAALKGPEQGKCIDQPQGSFCSKDSDCGVRQKCDTGKCRGLYMRAGEVVEGATCAGTSQCGDNQRCVYHRCKEILFGATCKDNSECGNGQLCPGESKGCVPVPSGGPCDVAGACGNGMTCVKGVCMKEYGYTRYDLENALPSNSQCFTHNDCAFSQRCQRNRCSLTLEGKFCRSNGDCGNGQTCSDSNASCTVVAEEAECNTAVDCGNSQLCREGRCHGVYGRGVTAIVSIGSHCLDHTDCGHDQLCSETRCRSAPLDRRCETTHECGNGQKCVTPADGSGETEGLAAFSGGRCKQYKEGQACKDDTACARNQKCVGYFCRREYGQLVEAEVRRRAEEDWMMADQWHKMVQQRLKQLELEWEGEKHLNNTVGMSTVVAVQKLQEERERLRQGRIVLEQELERRALWSTPSDVWGSGEDGCALCKAEEDIKKLQDEIARLRAELGQCKTRAQAYTVSCEQDLNFQIGKLQEEVARRQALLKEELRQLEQEEARLENSLKECRGRTDGCPPEEEQKLLLQLMRSQEELMRRRNTASREEKIIIYRCLYMHRSTSNVEGVAKQFTASLAQGCAKQDQIKDAALRACLCDDFLKQQKIAEDAAKRADIANAVKEASEEQASQEKKSEKEAADESAEVAKQVAMELLYNHESKQRDWDTVLQNLRKEQSADLENIIKRVREKEKLLKDCADGKNCRGKGGGEKSNGVTPKVDQAKLDKCTQHIRTDSIRQNIEAAFVDGQAQTGCALLSLASNQLLQDVYRCLCKEDNPSEEMIQVHPG